MPATERATAAPFTSGKARLAYRQHSDGELLGAFVVHREEAAFAALVARHAPKVIGVCRGVLANRQDAEDAFQVVLLKLVREADGLREEVDVGCWLTNTAVGIALNVRRGKKRRQKQDRQYQDSLTTQTTHPLDEIERGEASDHIQDAISGLPEQLRVPFVLRFVEGKSRSEVARELGWPEGTVASRVRKAKRLMRQELMRRGIEACSVGS